MGSRRVDERAASDLFAGNGIRLDSEIMAETVFEQVVVLAIAASVTLGHHVLSMGNLVKEWRQYNFAPRSLLPIIRDDVRNLQRQLLSVTFEDWPLGFLLYLIDFCEVFTRIRFQQAKEGPPRRNGNYENYRVIELPITEEGYTGKMQLVSPFRDSSRGINACLGIFLPGGGGEFSGSRNEFVRQSLCELQVNTDGTSETFAWIDFRNRI